MRPADPNRPVATEIVDAGDAAPSTDWLTLDSLTQGCRRLKPGTVTTYTPADAADWEGDPPTTMAEALDRIAAALAAADNKP
jgi:hypothetical protein